MKMEENTNGAQPRRSHKTAWIVASLILLFAAIGAGGFWYIGFWKKSTAEVMEAIPAPAVYVMQLNDNDGFIRNSAKCMPSLSSLFSLNALAGFEYFHDQFANQGKKDPITVSGHLFDNRLRLLLVCHASENDFAHLLKVLKINKRNFLSYKRVKIFEVASHQASFYICQHNGMFCAAEDLKLLYQSINCLGTRKSLVAQNDFASMHALVLKNPRQNWLIVNHKNFVQSQIEKIAEPYQKAFSGLSDLGDWSAYIMSFSDYEMQLTGYSTVKKGSLFQSFEQQQVSQLELPANILPCGISSYQSFNIPQSDAFLCTRGASDEVRTAYREAGVNELLYFTFGPTDDQARCIAIAADTAVDSRLMAPDSTGAVSTTNYRHFEIRASAITHIGAAASRQQGDIESRYYVENKGYYIFADSIDVLKRYIDAIASGNTLATNQQYLFSESHLPSMYGYELFFQNQDGRMNRYFTTSAQKKKNNIPIVKLFAFNALKPINGIIPNNIYIRFGSN